MNRYNKLNEYLKQKYGERTLKICIDGGFTCPNRDGTKGSNGCLFCSAQGSGDHLCSSESITEQIKRVIDYKKERANKFIVYFQSYSNTYAPIPTLTQKYTEAISASEKIVGLDLATRPDCISSAVVDLLSQINQKLPVTTELGLQTVNESIGNKINRQYTNNDFILAVEQLSRAGIEIVAHMMVGLPNETHQDIVNIVDFLNSLPISGIKIHATYVVKDSSLFDLYQSNEYTPITKEHYLEELVYIITHLRPDIIIHRITGDPPKDTFVAPEWITHKKYVLNNIDKLLKERDLYQGIFYNKKHI